MSENNEGIDHLTKKLDMLLSRQTSFSIEINELRQEINKVKASVVKPPVSEVTARTTAISVEVPKVKQEIPTEATESVSDYIRSQKRATETVKPEPIGIPVVKPVNPSANKPKAAPAKSDFERFIGENIINKIGIVITVLGVGIGAKYSIEHQLISPLTRIILGYLIGIGLMAFGIKLKKNYENYSAVLVSGAIAILYFITFAAYSFYGLFPQAVAFAMMVIFTAFSVVTAINYNKQIIAHLGLVGAYAVPFLLSDGSGRVLVLFSYMAIINVGILLIAFKKYWKPIYYSSFGFTWMIFASWFAFRYEASNYLLALTFLSVFFAIFYAIFLGYKLIQKKEFEIGDIILLLLNSFVFYGLGYAVLSGHPTGKQLLGLFTLVNAVVHFAVSAVIYRQKLADRNLFYLVSGLVLVFITLAIPVQLDGNWVTLIWVGEAALVFWIGRTKDVPVYERLSYPLMLLAFSSLFGDWNLAAFNDPFFVTDEVFTPVFNTGFLSSILFSAAFAFIFYVDSDKKHVRQQSENGGSIASIFSYIIPSILLVVIYSAFRNEIISYFNQLLSKSVITISSNGNVADTIMNWDIGRFREIWLFNYTMLFLTVLSFINFSKFRNRTLGFVTLCLSTVVIVAFLSEGLLLLSELRESYLAQTNSVYYYITRFNLGIRYIAFAFAGLMLFSIYRCLRQNFMQPVSFGLRVAFDILVHASILWIVSSELITWLSIMNSAATYKLGLSILWGIYALILIAIGINKRKKHLRISAIVLFGVTLVKLFVYDIASLNTISKTIVFVSLGLLLLIISFLYNKYAKQISGEDEI